MDVGGGGALLAFIATVPAGWAWLSGSAMRPDLGHRWFLWFGLLWSALLLAVLHGPEWLRRPFAHPALRLVGVISFSAYLWHMPVLDGVRAHAGAHGPLAGWFSFAAALGLAGLSWWWLERPWRAVRVRPS